MRVSREIVHGPVHTQIFVLIDPAKTILRNVKYLFLSFLSFLSDIHSSSSVPSWKASLFFPCHFKGSSGGL